MEFKQSCCVTLTLNSNKSPTEFPHLDKQQQTMMWQQNQYMDSGINSGATTQVSHFYAGYSHKSNTKQDVARYVVLRISPLVHL
jgi:hypothetical protein